MAKRKKNGKKRIITLPCRVAKMLDLPEEGFEFVLKMTVLGNEYIVIENHRGIYELFEHSISILSDLGTVKISGEKLMLRETDADRLYITGNIKGINIE